MREGGGGLTMPALTKEQVILKLMSALRTRTPHYREDTEALEAGREWLESRPSTKHEAPEHKHPAHPAIGD